ncbi:MAG: DUF1080 domain-containing protein [Acidobacteriia bacterium]|nr:DUF1080 domain-containing protein [Terriglobia bacterium]
MTRLTSISLFSIVLFTGAGASAGVEDFNGRWNITVKNEPKARAWWLEVNGAGSAGISGKFVGAPGGQLDVIPQIRTEGNELVWVFERAYQRPGVQSKGIYRARIEGGQLVGTRDTGPANPRLSFTGKRAPVLRETDDGKWKAGKPVSLLNGKDMGGWYSRVPGQSVTWFVQDGVMKNGEKAVDIVSEAKFWNFKMRVEFKVADRSNSGIGLRGRYEVQIYGDHGRAPDGHGNGAVYSRIVPAVNATLPQDQWQVFEITLIGRQVTVVLNGKTLVDRKEIEGLTAMAHDPNEDQPGPISLQGDHGPVAFRKIEVTPLVR